MSDARLRELRRRWQQSGAVGDEAALLRERVRVGDLTALRLRIAAYAGVPGAILAYGERNLDDYLDLVTSIEWLAKRGRPSERDAQVTRIANWAEWPGHWAWTEDCVGTPFEYLLSGMYDDIFPDGDRERADPGIRKLWDQIDGAVRRRARRNVPLYDPEEDYQHGPTVCVWDASSYSAVVGCHLTRGSSVPWPVAEVWMWLADGYWPCGVDRRGRLIVF